MFESKVEMMFLMFLLEQRSFCLDYGLKTILFEYIPDSLGIDRIRDGSIDEFGSLNSIVQLASGDLVNNCMFITGGKLRWTSSLLVFLVNIEIITDPLES